MIERQISDSDECVVALEHLTGPSRGEVSWLTASVLLVFTGEDRMVRVRADAVPQAGESKVAVLFREGGTYRIEAAPDTPIWINRQPTTDRILRHGDTVEFGETGPLSRFRVFERRTPMRWPVEEVIGDSVSYLRFSRKPLGPRISWAAGDLLRRLVTDTTVLFRGTIAAALIALGVFAYWQYQTSVELRETLQRDALRLEGMAAALARARAEALSPGDLNALRDELTARMTSARDRIDALEQRSARTARVIAWATRSVVFLQGSYGLRHVESGRMLRHTMGPGSIPLMAPNGQPLLTLSGDGPVAEVHFTGTGFVLEGSSHLVTNRHVAVPWERGADPDRMEAEGMEPVMLRFLGFFPDVDEPVSVTLSALSETADLALLSLTETLPGDRGLTLAVEPPRVGEEVIVMGYPTGLRSMLAQAGAAFVDELQETGDTDFWSVSARLARAGLIAPLASRGIVGQFGDQAVVYDAETTHGGSGGPVLNADGAVIAVNAAILPEFGGSNLGVPVARLRELIAEADN